ncbi:MAG: PKD domain-containing protein [Myxococcota bacterium]
MLFFVTSAAFAAGEPPVAEAGLGLVAYVEDTVALNGTGSVDPEGDALTFAWTQVGGPPTDLQGADSSQPQFTVGDPGTFRFQLVVNDGTSDSAADTVEIVVPYRQIDGVATGCAAAPAPAWLGVAGWLLLVRRRR